jgi:hypothetical protein
MRRCPPFGGQVFSKRAALERPRKRDPKSFVRYMRVDLGPCDARMIEFGLDHQELEPANVEMLEEDLEQIVDVDLIDLAAMLGQPAIFMSNAPAPGPLPERLHADCPVESWLGRSSLDSAISCWRIRRHIQH